MKNAESSLPMMNGFSDHGKTMANHSTKTSMEPERMKAEKVTPSAAAVTVNGNATPSNSKPRNKKKKKQQDEASSLGRLLLMIAAKMRKTLFVVYR